MKLSVIVPVYNVEKYLRKCLDSILDQSFMDFELLLIDDGSTDHSLDICEEYKKKDIRIQVYSETNGGASQARNVGISKARGKYITFIDSDDYVKSDLFERLIALIEGYDADMSAVSSEKIYEDGSIVQFCKTKGTVIFSKEEALEDFFLDNHIFAHAVWAKLYKSEIIQSIIFPVGFTCEDEYVSFASIAACDKIAYDFSAFSYVYRMTSKSVSAKKYNVSNFDMFYMQCLCFKLMDGHPDIQKIIARRIVRSFIAFTGIGYGYLLFDPECRKKTKEMRHEVLDYYGIARLSTFENIAYYSARYCPAILGRIYALANRNKKGRTNEPVGEEKNYVVRHEKY